MSEGVGRRPINRSSETAELARWFAAFTLVTLATIVAAFSNLTL